MLKPWYEKGRMEAGCDEAGRGCLAGPVTAAAVILPDDYFSGMLNDSKQLTPRQRETLRVEIEKEAIAYAVTHVAPKEIDDVNILNASFLAMHRSIEKLHMTPDLLLIDGNRFRPFRDIEHRCIIKGDGKYYSIAAASILAKTYRDKLMHSLHEEFPDYGWRSNVGYPTKEHRSAIQALGATPHHRMTFRLLPSQIELFGS